ARSALLGGLCLFVALFLGSRHRKPPLADPANGVLLAAARLMLIGAAGATKRNSPPSRALLARSTRPIWKQAQPRLEAVGGWASASLSRNAGGSKRSSIPAL
ncbi:MAG: hypothetical protein ACKOOH_02165, partial [Cyanobium sp.]